MAYTGTDEDVCFLCSLQIFTDAHHSLLYDESASAAEFWLFLIIKQASALSPLQLLAYTIVLIDRQI